MTLIDVVEVREEERNPKTCFVIGPIGDRQAPFESDGRKLYEQSMQVWDYVIKPVCEMLNIEAVRADMIAQPGEITEQVFQHIRDDDIVVADVSGGNANVMYELGLRHTTNKMTIQLGERESLPFDITVIRTIKFVRTETGLVEAREALQKAITAGMQHGTQPVTATRVLMRHDSDKQSLSEVVELDEEMGFLDMIAEAEEAMPLLVKVSENLAATFNRLPMFTDEALEKMAKSDARGGGASGRLRIAQSLSSKLEEPTADIEQLAADFVAYLEQMNPGISHLIDVIENDPKLLEEKETEQFSESIKELTNAAEHSLSQVEVMANAVQDLGQISNRLRSVTRRMSTALRQISSTSHTIKRWGQRLNNIEAE